MESTTVINGDTYRIGTLSAIKQFHLVRRIVPLAAKGSEGLLALQSAKPGSSAKDFAALLVPLIDEVAKMPDEEAEYVIFTCLGVVSREVTGGGFAPMLDRNGHLMYQDLTMEVMLQLVGAVIKGNLSGFFKGLGEQVTSPSP